MSEEALYLAGWTIVLTNLPRTRADYAQVLVLLRLRWQIERLFRLWKEDGKIDEWRTKKPYRILCEFYAKLCAMIMQSALLAEGCWSDPYRSIVKAAQAIRREVNRIPKLIPMMPTRPSGARSLRFVIQMTASSITFVDSIVSW